MVICPRYHMVQITWIHNKDPLTWEWSHRVQPIRIINENTRPRIGRHYLLMSSLTQPVSKSPRIQPICFYPMNMMTFGSSHHWINSHEPHNSKSQVSISFLYRNNPKLTLQSLDLPIITKNTIILSLYFGGGYQCVSPLPKIPHNTAN